MPYLPNGAAQRATIHGMGDPTHRRSFGGILVSKLQNSWLHFLCGPTGPSVNCGVLLPSTHSEVSVSYKNSIELGASNEMRLLLKLYYTNTVKNTNVFFWEVKRFDFL